MNDESVVFESFKDSWFRDCDLLNNLKILKPAEIKDGYSAVPRWGVDKDRYMWNLVFKDSRYGSAVLIIRPPKLCPIKEIT